MDVPERNRSELRRTGGARHAADITRFGEESRAARRHLLRPLALHAQRHQPLGNPSMPAVKDSDDDLLPHVASLGHRDRAIFDPCFERDRLFGHIETEQRITSFNSRRLDGLGIRDDRAFLDERALQVSLAPRLDVQDEAGRR